MQDAETVLSVLRERGGNGLPLTQLYRQMFSKNLYLLRVQVLDQLRPCLAERERPGAGVAVGVAGVGEHVAQTDPGRGIAVSTATSTLTGSCRQDEIVARRANSGMAGPVSSGIMIPADS
jgi:hypothetical protein